MAFWLFKEEPTNYSFDRLLADQSTTWSGIRNALALKHLRQCKPGDLAFFYHTGKEKAIVGVLKITRGHDPQTIDIKEVSVEVSAVKRLPRPVTLAEIKQQKALSTWDLVRLPRLSIVPVTPVQWKLIEKLASQASV